MKAERFHIGGNETYLKKILHFVNMIVVALL